MLSYYFSRPVTTLVCSSSQLLPTSEEQDLLIVIEQRFLMACRKQLLAVYGVDLHSFASRKLFSTIILIDRRTSSGLVTQIHLSAYVIRSYSQNHVLSLETFRGFFCCYYWHLDKLLKTKCVAHFAPGCFPHSTCGRH